MNEAERLTPAEGLNVKVVPNSSKMPSARNKLCFKRGTEREEKWKETREMKEEREARKQEDD